VRSTAVVTAGILSGLTLSVPSLSLPLSAADAPPTPRYRPRCPGLKTSINAYSFHRRLGNKSMTLDDVLDFALNTMLMPLTPPVISLQVIR